MSQEKIHVEVDGSARGLQAAAATAKRSVRDLGDSSERESARAGRSWERLRSTLSKPFKARVEAETGKAQRDVGAITAALRRFDGTKARATAAVDVQGAAQLAALRSQVRSFGRESATASAGGNRLGGTVGRINRQFTFTRNLLRLLRWPLLAKGLQLAAVNAFSLTSALAPLSGALIAYPGFMAAAAQGSAVWKLATGGLSEAVGGLNEKLDTESEAFKNLSPEAQRFARTLQGLKPDVRELQQTAQRGLFPGLREGLLAARRNLPVVERLIGRTARALGAMAASAGKALGSAEWGRDLERVGNTNVVVLTRLGRAAGHVADAVRHIAVAAGPTLRALAGDVADLASNFEDAAREGRESGRLGAYFERSRQVLWQLAHIAKDVVEAIRNMGRAAGPSGDRLLNSIGEVAERWRAWTASVRGQNAMRAYFEKARVQLSNLTNFLADQAKIWASPRLSLGEKIAASIERLHLGEALARVINDALPVMAREAAGAAPVVASAFVEGWLEAPLGGKIITAAWVLGTLGVGNAVTSAGGAAAGQWVGSYIAGLRKNRGKVAAATAATTAGSGAAGGAAGGAATAVGGTLAGGAAGGGAVAALKKWGGRFLKFAGTRVFLPVGIALTVGEVLGGKLGRYSGSKGWGNLFKDVKVAVDFVGQKVGDVWNFVSGRNLNRLIRKGVAFVGRKVGPVWRSAKAAVSKAVRFVGRKVGEVWRSAKAAVSKAIKFVGRKAGELWETAKDVWGKVIEFVSEAVGDLWRRAKDTWKKAIEFVSEAVGDLWRRAKDTWDKSIRFVAWAVGSLWNTAGRTITKFVRFVARKIGFAEGGIAVPGFADGGTIAKSAEPAMQKAVEAGPRGHSGGKFSRPTYLVGEGHRPEFVITTDQRHRKANIGYLRAAAAALGVAGFARGGYPGAFGHTFRYSPRAPRTTSRGGHPAVRRPGGGWMTPLAYRIGAASERESFYELLGKMRGGRSSGEWSSLSRRRRARITAWWERRRDMIDKRHEFWEQRLQELLELNTQRSELIGQRRRERRFGHRVGGAQMGVMRGFAGEFFAQGGLPYVGSFARGGRIRVPQVAGVPRRVMRSGIAMVHDGEHVQPRDRGGAGARAAAPAAQIKVDVVLKDRAGALVELVDARADARADARIEVATRKQANRTRAFSNAPGRTGRR